MHIGARNGVHAVRSSRFDRILLRWVTNRTPAAAAALALWPAPGPAQDGSLEEIEVTGSRIARRDFTSASPIVSVPAEAFRESSSVSVERTLGQLPQFVPTATGTSNSPTNDGQANLSLRGIGSVQTLVLVDGKRLMPADGLGTVDLNVLPPALIESVEVVTGGASAAYGSDAIAGVVNFRLRDRFEGVELHGEWTQTERGDGREYSAGILAGSSFAAGRGDVIAYLGYAEREQVNQDERGFSRHAWGYFPGETAGFGPGGAFLPEGTGITEEGVSVVFASPSVFNQVFLVYGYPPGSVPYQGGFRRQSRPHGVHDRRRPHAEQRRQLPRRDRSRDLQRPLLQLRHGADDRAADAPGADVRDRPRAIRALRQVRRPTASCCSRTIR